MSGPALELPLYPPYGDLPGPAIIPQRNSLGLYSSYTTEDMSKIYDKIWNMRNQFDELKKQNLDPESYERERNILLEEYKELLSEMLLKKKAEYERFRSIMKGR